MKKILAIYVMGVCLASGYVMQAQSRHFKMGQWMEIQNSVMRGIARYYVDSIPADKMYKDGIDSMLEDLDPYTIYVPESEQSDFEMMISNTYGGIGAVIYKPSKDVNVVINEPYADSPAAKAGLQCGDEIVAIDGKSVMGLDASQASSKMKGKPGTKVVFSVRKVRTGEMKDVEIVRERIHLPDVEYYGMLDSRTGYIYQTGFTAGVSEVVKNAVLDLKKQGMQRLVLDLRGNGGGLLEEAVNILSLFVPKGTMVVSSKGTDGECKYYTKKDPIDTELPVMVMVNSGSASASEIVSGAMQDLDRGFIAGKRTYGKGLVQKIVPVAYNGQLKVTVAKYYTPSGRCVQAKDYSHRAEDGSVGNIPDSLTHEFTTAKGRKVRDGGGITPDAVVESPQFNRFTVAAVYGGLTSNWPLEYVKTHQTIAPVDEFCLSDEEYAEFVEWAAAQDFDSRSESETYCDLLEEQLKKDGMYEEASAVLDSLKAVVKMDKKSGLMHSREALRPLLEEEIAVRYYYQGAGIKLRLRTDTQLKEALSLWK